MHRRYLHLAETTGVEHRGRLSHYVPKRAARAKRVGCRDVEINDRIAQYRSGGYGFPTVVQPSETVGFSGRRPYRQGRGAPFGDDSIGFDID